MQLPHLQHGKDLLVQVHLFEHGAFHGTPDAVFPNNWFTMHSAGEANGGCREKSLVLYPLKVANSTTFLQKQFLHIYV